MSTASSSTQVEYPTSDGQPMAETEAHIEAMTNTIATLRDFFAADEMVHVSGNLLMFYVEGNGLRHVSPDVFVAKGVSNRLLENYLVWEEGKAPDFIIELTSKSTKNVDVVTKYELYRDVLQVTEYFLFDPKAEYLKPPLRGYRLIEGAYVPIEPIEGRLPALTIGLHLEARGRHLGLFDPVRRILLPTPLVGARREALLAKRKLRIARRASRELAESLGLEREQSRAERSSREQAEEKVRLEQEKVLFEQARNVQLQAELELLRSVLKSRDHGPGPA